MLSDTAALLRLLQPNCRKEINRGGNDQKMQFDFELTQEIQLMSNILRRTTKFSLTRKYLIVPSMIPFRDNVTRPSSMVLYIQAINVVATCNETLEMSL